MARTRGTKSQNARHEHLEAGLADLALGLLYGSEREAVLGHVGSCSSCGADLEDLAAAAEALLLLAPAVEPPAGFENRVLTQLKLVGPLGGDLHG